MAIYDVTDLNVYKRSLKTLELVYQLVRQIPPSHERLRKQIINSSESVAPLITEGFAKRESDKEFKRFLKIALGSSDETITHAREIYLLSKTIKNIDINLCIKIGNEYKIISKQLNKMHTNWRNFNKR